MSHGKKYSAYAIFNADKSWTARVVRRGTASGPSLERERAGFISQEAALLWVKEPLERYLAQRKERITRSNANRSARRIRQAARDTVLANIVTVSWHGDLKMNWIAVAHFRKKQNDSGKKWRFEC